MSTIVITAFDANGKPKPGQRMILSAIAGTLNPTEVLTGTDGKASAVVYRARRERAGLDGDNHGDPGRQLRVVMPRTSTCAPFASSCWGRPFRSRRSRSRRRLRRVLDPVTFDASGSSLDGAGLRQRLQLQLGLWRRLERVRPRAAAHVHVLGRVQRDADGHVARPRDVEQHHQASASLRPPALPVALTSRPVRARSWSPSASGSPMRPRSVPAPPITGHLIDFGDNTTRQRATGRADLRGCWHATPSG